MAEYAIMWSAQINLQLPNVPDRDSERVYTLLLTGDGLTLLHTGNRASLPEPIDGTTEHIVPAGSPPNGAETQPEHGGKGLPEQEGRIFLAFSGIESVSLEPGDPHELWIQSGDRHFHLSMADNRHDLVHKFFDLLKQAVSLEQRAGE